MLPEEGKFAYKGRPSEWDAIQMIREQMQQHDRVIGQGTHNEASNTTGLNMSQHNVCLLR